jgi:hypothetical protein
LDSLVIKEADKSRGQCLHLLLNSFDRPVQLELMFRASEHDFRADTFHEKCDDVEDTLTLVRTEFGKAIGGFSHYKWNSVKSNWVHSKDMQSFLLSFDRG